jgi:glycosyltransferase involved in cell wall biosynthesis
MNILFLHQNMPGQFGHLASRMAQIAGHHVTFVTRRTDVDLPGVRRITYRARRTARADTHHYVRPYEEAVLNGQQVARVCLDLRREGFYPDVVVAHPGWGESLFVKDVFRRAKILSYCEYYYHGRGADVGFDPEVPANIDAICRARARNAHLLLSLEAADRGWSPTEWQRHRHPPEFLPNIAVVHDGVDTDLLRPDATAWFALPDGRRLTAADPVVTYTARNLEPYRGFPTFMRAVPELLRQCPEAHVVVVGGDNTSYGPPPAPGMTWRKAMLREIGPLDQSRVHLMSRLPVGTYRRLLQVSRLHVYLTVPFVLSWSCLEAMACGAVVLGSRTPPVEEVIEDGRNGFLTEFFDHHALTARAAELLEAHASLEPVRRCARETVLSRYELSRCLVEQTRLVRSLS